MAMDVCDVHCTDTNKTVKADILSRSDKSISVALHGTTLKLVMNRSDIRRPYVAHFGKLEFTTRG